MIGLLLHFMHVMCLATAMECVAFYFLNKHTMDIFQDDQILTRN